MFLAVRGIDSLGSNFTFPTCPRFFNIFHPFDPIAYRAEGLIKPEYGLTLRPVTIPHHKGRKRMHLELKDTVTKIMSTDIKQKLLDSFSATINAVYSMTVGNSYDSSAKTVEQVELIFKWRHENLTDILFIIFLCCEWDIAHDVINKWRALNIGKLIFTSAHWCISSSAVDNNLFMC